MYLEQTGKSHLHWRSGFTFIALPFAGLSWMAIWGLRIFLNDLDGHVAYIAIALCCVFVFTPLLVLIPLVMSMDESEVFLPIEPETICIDSGNNLYSYDGK